MKNFIVSFVFFALLGSVGYATITAEKEYALNRMNATAQKYALGTELAKTPNVVVGKYSFAVQGGAVGNVNLLRDLEDTNSTITIPDNAVVQNVFVDVLTAANASSTASVKIELVNDGDLLGSTAYASVTGILQGVPDFATVGDYIKLAADKTLKAEIVTNPLTAGKFNVYVSYVLGD